MKNLSKTSPIEIADDIIATIPTMMCCNEVFYLFNGEHYEVLKERQLKKIVHDFFIRNDPSAWNTNRVTSIVEAMKFHPSIKEVEETDTYDDFINLKNGILQFSTRELRSHSPEFLFTSVVKVEYNSEARIALHFNDFLRTVFTLDDGKPDHETISNILQLGGYLIYPQIKMEKLFIFYGTGSNGKSLLIDHVFKKFFHKKFMSSLSLNVLSNESSSSRKKLLTSRMNFATEQKSSDAIESEELKKVVTGESISIERKYEDTIDHEPKCKILVAGNRFMRFKDTSEGTRRRLMIFNFKNRFETSKKKFASITNATRKRIFMAADKDELVAGLQQELPAILNLFLDGLDKLRANNWRFEESANNEEVFKEYIEESDYLGDWISETLEDDETGNGLSVKDAVEGYRAWWEYNFPDKRFDVSTKLMGRRIKDIFRRDPIRRNVDIKGKKTTISEYPIKFKEDDIWKQLQFTTENQPFTESQPEML